MDFILLKSYEYIALIKIVKIYPSTKPIKHCKDIKPHLSSSKEFLYYGVMFISLDLETTGFNADKDQIIEFGAIKFDLNGPKERLGFLINPEIEIPEIVSHITKSYDKDVKDAPLFADKKQEIQDFIGDLPIVGHNIQFDTTFLREKGIPLDNPEYDTFEFAGLVIPDAPSYSLEILSQILELTHQDKHRALDDAIAAMELFLKLVDKFQQLEAPLIERIHKACQKSDWPMAKVLLELQCKEPKALSIPVQKAEKVDNAVLSNDFELFERQKPYHDLASELATNISNDAYLALPYDLFRELSKSLPENIAKLDLPENYLSPKRLEEFENQEFLEGAELRALIKYIIWSEHTKTGLLSEVNLFHEEQRTKTQVNANEHYSNPDQEPFIKKAKDKDKGGAAICSYKYIIDKMPEVNELIILDFASFSQSVYHGRSEYLSLEKLIQPLSLLPQNPTTENLISKCTVLFGLIGMIFEKYNDESPYTPRSNISEPLFNTKEWQDINKLLGQLVETSKELAEINSQKTITYLKNWKQNLESLISIFNKPELDKYMFWIEKNYQETLILRKCPYSLSIAIHDVLSKSKKYKIIDDIIDLKDDGKFFKQLYGLPEDSKIEPPNKAAENLNIAVVEDYNPDKFTAITDDIIEYCRQKRGKVALIFNSKSQVQKATVLLDKALKKDGIAVVSQLSGSIGKLEERYKADPENSILIISSRSWPKFSYNNLIETALIDKIPFNPPSDSFIVSMSKNFDDPFNEFQVPLAIVSLYQIINHLKTGHPSDKNLDIFILDNRIKGKRYGQAFMEKRSSINRVTTTKINNLK